MQALILAAGMGKRLGELTSDRTKCLVPLHGQTLLERMLLQLSSQGIAKVTLVVGYFAEKVRALAGDRFAGMVIEYIENPVYSRTNNIYSLFLAKEVLLQDDTILLESDLILDEAILARLLGDPRPDLATVAKCQAWMDGTILSLDEEDGISGFASVNRVDSRDLGDYFKTVNIYKFSKAFSTTHYVPFLVAYCQAMGHNEYYEQVLRVITLLEKQSIKALRLDAEKWYEIDDVQDLAIAETLFSPADGAYEAYSHRFGGFWRFPGLLDFCYLVNPFFPPRKLVSELKEYFDALVRQYPSGQQVIRHLAARLYDLPAGQILVGNGAAELIAALQEGYPGVTGIVRPSFEEYAERTPRGRLRVFQPVTVDFSYSLDDLLGFVRSEQVTRLVLVNPDNPTGHFLPAAGLPGFVAALAPLGCELVLDESFVDFAAPEARFSLLEKGLLAAHPNLIVVRSISKSYGVPGLRLGLLASGNSGLMRALEAKISIWNINSLGEFFLQVVGKYGAAYRQACDALVLERERFAQALAGTSLLRPLPSAANYLFCEVLPPLTPQALAQALLVEYQILVKDCASKPGVGGRPFIRLAIREGQENDRLVSAVQAICQDALGRQGPQPELG